MLLYSIYMQCGLHVMLYAVGTSDVRFTTFKAYSIQLCHRPWFIHQFPHKVYTDRDRRHLFYQVEKGMIKAIEGFGLCCCALRFYNCGTSAISELCDSNCKNQSRNNSNFLANASTRFLKNQEKKSSPLSSGHDQALNTSCERWPDAFQLLMKLIIHVTANQIA